MRPFRGDTNEIMSTPDNTSNGGGMSVREAGKRGGDRVKEKYGSEFYEAIGHKGGQRVKELIEEGKKARGMGPER